MWNSTLNSRLGLNSRHVKIGIMACKMLASGPVLADKALRCGLEKAVKNGGSWAKTSFKLTWPAQNVKTRPTLLRCRFQATKGPSKGHWTFPFFTNLDNLEQTSRICKLAIELLAMSSEIAIISAKALSDYCSQHCRLFRESSRMGLHGLPDRNGCIFSAFALFSTEPHSEAQVFSL